MPNNHQFKAIPSSSSRSNSSSNGNGNNHVDSSPNKQQLTKNGESTSHRFTSRDSSSNNNSTSSISDDHEATLQEETSFPYQDGTLEGEETTDEENYSNLDLNTVKLFVGQIPYSYSEDNLFPLFSQFGPVAEIVVIRDRFTFKSRGCAFVSFRNKQDADSCIRELNQRLKLPPLNTPLRVKYAYTEQQLDNVNENIVNNAPNLTTSSSPNDQSSEKSQDLTIASNFLSCLNIEKYEIGVPHPENKLFIRNIPKNVTEDELSELFESFGEILDVVVLRTTIHTSKGCGFIKFVNQESADMVINTFRREIMIPIQEYQQAVQQEGATGQSNEILVELTNKLLESSFLMNGAITPLLVRYADNDYAHSNENEQSYHVDSTNGHQYNSRRRKSYPFSYNRNVPRGYQAQHYHYQNPYYDHSNGYTNHHGMYPHNYYYPPQEGTPNGAIPGSSDTVYFYHLYNNASYPTGASTTTTISAPTVGLSTTESQSNGGSEQGPSPVPPMYYYYPPYYYQHQYASTTTTTPIPTTHTNINSLNNTNNAKYSNHTSFKKQKPDRKHQERVTKCSSDA